MNSQERREVQELRRLLDDARQELLLRTAPDSEARLRVVAENAAREREEAALEQSRQLLEATQGVAHVGSWSTGGGADAPIIWSRECARIFGREWADSPTVLEFLSWVHADDRPRVLAASRSAHAQQLPCENEHRIVRQDGEQRWVYARTEVRGSFAGQGEQLLTFADETGASYPVIGVVQDITERKAREDALRASEARYRQMVEHTSEGIWMYDAHGVTTFVNQQMARLLGYSVEELVGRPVFDFVAPGTMAEVQERYARRKRGVAERGRARLTRKDGSTLWASIHADPLLDAAGNFQGSLALVTDISEQHRADEARNLLAAVVESSDDAILGMTLDGVIMFANPRVQDLFGYAATELAGQPIAILLPADRVLESQQLVQQIVRGEPVRHHETVRKHKNGSLVNVSLSVSPIRDATGALVGVSKIARDIGVRLASEAALRDTEEQLRQSQKMEAVGSLAGGIAHDFNNLLSVILGYTTLLIDAGGEASSLREDLLEIHSAGLRAMTLTQQLLAFSRKQILQPLVLDVNAVVSSMQQMLTRLVGEDVELTLALAATMPQVLADPSQLEQVLMNLVVNARDAMPNGGTIRVATANAELSESGGGKELALRAGAYVLITVTDTGVGMDAATKARIFEPFFTTKETTKGTGLGLSMAYGIITQSGGTILVQSEPQRGTTFEVYLPQSGGAPEPLLRSVPSVEGLGGDETILVVEDEEAVRGLLCTILRKQGYRVLQASNGAEALRIAESSPDPVHLLLTDVVMPKMSGRELALQLGKARPRMKVLFVSGYTENTIEHHGVLDEGVEYLAKPVLPDVLLRKIRRVLGRSPASS